MGNCTSIQDSDDEHPTENARRQIQATRDEQRNDVVVLSENPRLTYKNDDFMLSNDGSNYGGKIFTGYSGVQQVLLKMIYQQEKKKMERELSILSQLSHQNIATILYPFDINERECFLVMTKFGTNLKNSIGTRKDNTQKMNIMLQLTDVMSYLQQNRIVHLELSPRNVYIDDETDQIKLINFHKSQKLKRMYGVYEFNDYISGYAAPEIVKQKKVFLSSDIYALGCLFYFIITNGFDLPQMEYENQAAKISAQINTIKDDSTFNVLCKDLIQKMLNFAPNKRISISTIKGHPWSWSAEKMTKLIVDISKLTEKDSKFISVLFKGSKKVINGDWTLKLERNVIQTLQEIRQKYQTNNGLSQDEVKGTSILSLVRQLRNLHVHASNDKLVKIMGDNDEEFMKYWNRKFPLLICHLYKCKLDYESNENGS